MNWQSIYTLDTLAQRHISPSKSQIYISSHPLTIHRRQMSLPLSNINRLPGSALPIVSADLTGRTVIVTGANTGLGYAAALKFLRMNPARVVLAVRDVSKGLEAVQRLASDLSTGDGPNLAVEDVVQVWECDLASFASVERFAQRADEELARLDIAVLNAAVATAKWAMSADGWEVS